MRCATTLVLAASIWAFSTQGAHAVDGVTEINQARAISGGVTPGDTAGFPVTIDQPGAYRLTSNLDVRGEPLPQNVLVVSVTADDVTLDLNGFEIIGSVVCSGEPLGCTPTLGVGIGVHSTSGDNLVIRNGTIRGMGRRAVQVNIGKWTRLESLRVVWSGEDGVSIDSGCVVRNGVFVENGGFGIISGSGCLMEGNVVSRNGGAGVYTLTSGLFENTLIGNADEGFVAFFSGYAGNTLVDNNGGVDQVDMGIDFGSNVCQTDTTCP